MHHENLPTRQCTHRIMVTAKINNRFHNPKCQFAISSATATTASTAAPSRRASVRFDADSRAGVGHVADGLPSIRFVTDPTGTKDISGSVICQMGRIVETPC